MYFFFIIIVSPKNKLNSFLLSYFIFISAILLQKLHAAYINQHISKHGFPIWLGMQCTVL